MNKHNIFVDTNVLIGAYSAIQKDEHCLKYLYSLTGKRLFTSSLSIAQLVSVFQKRKTNEEIKQIVKKILAKFTIISFEKKDIETAITYDGSDIEDNIQYVISGKFNCFYFVTNNIKDYNKLGRIFPVPPSKIALIKRD